MRNGIVSSRSTYKSSATSKAKTGLKYSSVFVSTPQKIESYYNAMKETPRGYLETQIKRHHTNIQEYRQKKAWLENI